MKTAFTKAIVALCATVAVVLIFSACDQNRNDGELAALRAEVQLLKDKMEIQDVLWRYGLRFDLDRRDEWFELFADDCQFSSDVPGFLYELDGLEEIRAHYTRGPGGKDRVEQQKEQEQHQ